MSGGIALPEPERHKTGTDHGERDQQITATLDLLARLSRELQRVEARLNRLAKQVHDDSSTQDTGEQDTDPSAPAPWVWFSPPLGAEDDPDTGGDPRDTVATFVAWFNCTYTGLDGGRATPIPDCWHQHPGLAAELATLTYTWRAAHLGPDARARDAQYWHDRWRPGFVERLHRDWVHPDCLDGHHQPTGAPTRPDRHTLTDHHTRPTADPSHTGNTAENPGQSRQP